MHTSWPSSSFLHLKPSLFFLCLRARSAINQLCACVLFFSFSHFLSFHCVEKMPTAAWPTYWSEGGGQWECLAADPKYTFSEITAMIYAPSARTLFVAGE